MNIFEAAKSGNLTLLKECIANGESVNQIDATGTTPLYHAVLRGHTDVVTYLTVDHPARWVPHITGAGGDTVSAAALDAMLKERGVSDAIVYQRRTGRHRRRAPPPPPAPHNGSKGVRHPARPGLTHDGVTLGVPCAQAAEDLDGYYVDVDVTHTGDACDGLKTTHMRTLNTKSTSHDGMHGTGGTDVGHGHDDGDGDGEHQVPHAPALLSEWVPWLRTSIAARVAPSGTFATVPSQNDGGHQYADSTGQYTSSQQEPPEMQDIDTFPALPGSEHLVRWTRNPQDGSQSPVPCPEDGEWELVPDLRSSLCVRDAGGYEWVDIGDNNNSNDNNSPITAAGSDVAGAGRGPGCGEQGTSSAACSYLDVVKRGVVSSAARA